MKTLKFNGKNISNRNILKTRIHFKEIYELQKKSAANNEFHVNDLKEYLAGKDKSIKEVLEGKHDHTFWFLQKAYFLLTGESVAFLPK